MTITIYSFTLMVASLFAISIYLYNIIRSIRKGSANPVSIVFISFNVVMLIWSVSFAIFHFSQNRLISQFWFKVGAVGYCLFIPLMLHLTLLVFIKHRITNYRWLLIISSTIGTIFIIAYVTSNLSFLEFTYSNGVWSHSFLYVPAWFVLYLLFFIFCTSACLYMAVKSFFSESSEQRIQGKIILASTLFCTIFGMFVNVIAPALKLNFIPAICDISIIVYLYSMRYIIEHYDLINICPEIVATDILERINDMVFLTDAEGLIIFFNESAGINIKYKSHELFGRHISIIVGDNSSLFKTNTNINMEVEIYTSDREAIPVRASISPIRCFKDNIGRLYVFHDLRMLFQLGQEVSQKQTLANTVIAANEKLTELDRMKSEFLCNISHELRTPLNLIISSLQLMDKKDSSKEIDLVAYRKYFNIVLQNSYRLTRMVNNIIDTARIDSGYLHMYQSNNDIVHFVEDIVDGVRMYAQEKGLSITFDTEIEEKIIAFDPDKIERVFLNLLSNAIKFTNKGGEISVAIKDGTDFIEISVGDTGIGISKQDQEIIFDKFIQADKSLARSCEGSGIGLSLVKALVEMHKGKITLQSELNKGSVFTVILPTYLIEQDNEIYTQYSTGFGKQKVNIEFSDIYL